MSIRTQWEKSLRLPRQDFHHTGERNFQPNDDLLSWAGRMPVWLSPAGQLTTKPSLSREGLLTSRRHWDAHDDLEINPPG